MRSKSTIPPTVVHPLHNGEARPMLFVLAVAVVAVLLAVTFNPFA
jgi:hypothetical protein